MARTDMHYTWEPVFSSPTGRLSSDSTHLSRFKKKDNRVASRTSGIEDSGPAPSSLDMEASQEPSPFPELSENLQSSEYKGGSIRSARAITSMNPKDAPGKFDSAQLLSASVLNESSDGLDSHSQKSKPMKPKVHIKPMLRKMSRDDAPSTSIDLSRSSTEQEGLGIYMSLERDRRHSESLTSMTYRRTSSGIHHRSTSGTSQFSTATGSSGSKRGSQYVCPMRPTPRAYTPSLSPSYQTSTHDSDDQEGGSPEVDSRILTDSEAQRPTRAASGPGPRLSLQIGDEPFPHRPDLPQPNIVSRSSFGYSRDNGSTLDTASPNSRSSFDFVFRARTRTSADPISRAATIQAARQAFEEKEAAKNRRLEKQQIKAEEKQTRHRSKRNQTEGQQSPAQQSPAAHSSAELSEKPGISHHSKQPEGQNRQPSASWKSQSKSTWVLFMTWLRTRVFKIRRKLRKLS